jgi:hypothetical protein
LNLGKREEKKRNARLHMLLCVLFIYLFKLFYMAIHGVKNCIEVCVFVWFTFMLVSFYTWQNNFTWFYIYIWNVYIFVIHKCKQDVLYILVTLFSENNKKIV